MSEDHKDDVTWWLDLDIPSCVLCAVATIVAAAGAVAVIAILAGWLP